MSEGTPSLPGRGAVREDHHPFHGLMPSDEIACEREVQRIIREERLTDPHRTQSASELYWSTARIVAEAFRARGIDRKRQLEERIKRSPDTFSAVVRRYLSGDGARAAPARPSRDFGIRPPAEPRATLEMFEDDGGGCNAPSVAS